jgi:NAD(P)-dependent dehydrogenase (short-subunit alcohol dehydrogenase family)
VSLPVSEGLSLFSLEGRVAIVTGAGSGIGQRISIGFASAGATVVLVDIDEQGLEETAQMILAVSPGNPSVPAKCDVSSEDQVLSLFDRVRRQPGRIDVLVNGAFTPTFGRPQAVGLDLWERAIKVNLTGYFLCARSAGRAMIDAGRGGSIINISSIAGVSGMGRGNFAYSVTKGGVVQMTRELAVEWGRYGIRVNAILPVQTRTKGFQARLDHPETDADALMGRLLKAIPLGRIAEPADFVGPALFLASDASAMVSGMLLPVDGGNLAMNSGARSDE